MMSKRPSIPSIPENEAMMMMGTDSRRSSIMSDKGWPDLKPLKVKVGGGAFPFAESIKFLL